MAMAMANERVRGRFSYKSVYYRTAADEEGKAKRDEHKSQVYMHKTCNNKRQTD